MERNNRKTQGDIMTTFTDFVNASTKSSRWI